MAQPTIYSPAFSFTTYQSSHPTDPLPGDSVDNELFNIATSIAQLINNIGLIQRSDGALANNSVGAQQLQAAISIGLNTVTPWITSTAYIANNFVYGPDNNIYQCLISHTSGTFSVDLANGKWVLVLSFATATTAATNAATSQTAAASSATAAAASAVAAQNASNTLKGTSATSQTPATGAMTFTTQAGLSFPVGGYLVIASNANPAVNNVFGTVTSYSGTTLVMNNTVANGSGAHTDWTISLSGARGATGATGAPGSGTGDMLSSNNLNDVASVSTARTNLGLGSAALQAAGFFCEVGNNLSDISSAATALSNLGGLSSTTAASTYAPLVSPAFTGTPSLPSGSTATTQATNDNSTKLATTAYVKNQSFPLMTGAAVGSLLIALYTVPSNLAINATTAASNLEPAQFYNGGGGAAWNGDVSLSGTWKSLQLLVYNGTASSAGLFQRIA